MPPTIRPAAEADLRVINDIYNEEVLHGTATFDVDPWSLDQRRAWLRETQHPHAAIVADDAGDVVGWGCLRPFRAKAAYRFTAEDSVYIHVNRRTEGIGALILARLIEIARENGFHSIIAGIAQDNPASDRLHLRHGFTLVGTEREVGYKFERWLDVSWYQRLL
jgi:phosphinothricin acetyltransferase